MDIVDLGFPIAAANEKRSRVEIAQPTFEMCDVDVRTTFLGGIIPSRALRNSIARILLIGMSLPMHQRGTRFLARLMSWGNPGERTAEVTKPPLAAEACLGPARGDQGGSRRINLGPQDPRPEETCGNWGTHRRVGSVCAPPESGNVAISTGQDLRPTDQLHALGNLACTKCCSRLSVPGRQIDRIPRRAQRLGAVRALYRHDSREFDARTTLAGK